MLISFLLINKPNKQFHLIKVYAIIQMTYKMKKKKDDDEN